MANFDKLIKDLCHKAQMTQINNCLPYTHIVAYTDLKWGVLCCS